MRIDPALIPSIVRSLRAVVLFMRRVTNAPARSYPFTRLERRQREVTMEARIRSLHHVTAITSDPNANFDFYSGVLGLRLAKRTVNFDDPGSYHLYYGDATGNPGTILTFFVWPGGQRGRSGAGQANALALAIPRAALGFWMQRLIEERVAYKGPERRFDEPVLVLHDPDGLTIELIGQTDPPHVASWTGSDVPAEHAIRGVHSATMWVEGLAASAKLLAEPLGFQPVGEDAGRVRYASGDSTAPGHLLDLQPATGFWPGKIGTGTIHHLAWRTPDEATQLSWRERLTDVGLEATPVLDRSYFHSIYFREPGGILFEIATDGPGFTIDEPADQLGSRLSLPSWLEAERNTIEEQLPPMKSFDTPPAKPDMAFTHRFVAAPDTAHAPTLLLLHGTGGDETDLLPIGQTLLPEANLLSPRGRVLEHGMPRFFRRLAEGVFDEADLIAQTGALADFVRAVATSYGFDPKRVIAVGYSNGANIAGSLLLLRPGVLAGAILFRPMVPLEPEPAPDLSGIPILLSAARHDQLIAPEQSSRLAEMLEGFGAQVTLIWQSGGHALTNADIDAAHEWLSTQSLA
jgi:predicted esterase/catechol 2,3-dioxygenase-like lactoylglutathione lyase family enzyme